MGKREVRQIRTAVVRLAGQPPGSPSGDDAQSKSRIRAAIRLVPGNAARWPDSSPTLITLQVDTTPREPTRPEVIPPCSRDGSERGGAVGQPGHRDRRAVVAVHLGTVVGEAVDEQQPAAPQPVRL